MTAAESFVDSSLLGCQNLNIRSIRESSQSYSIPRDVVSKYSVDSVSASVEQVISSKLVEDTFEQEEAFYIVDLGIVVKKLKQWHSLLPRVKPFYAIKCNSNPAIVRTLASMGVNFDCASKSEIQQVLGSGVAASRIIYANPTKMKGHISYAKSSGVDLMTFDNTDELRKIAECFPDSRLVLRIITDDSNSICRFSTKFGAPLDQVDSILSVAKELNLNVVGVSFHVGSGCMSTSSFTAAIRNAKRVFKQAEEKFGFRMSILDLGGGWPGTDDDGITFVEIANAIRPVLDELFPPADAVELIAEPGRYFVAESHTLMVNVFGKRSFQDEHGAKRFLYYVNDGVYQSFNCIFFDHAHPKALVYSPGGRTEQFKSTIFGPTCDSLDCIAKDFDLPELQVGEWLYFKNMGAYTVAAASPFNGFKSHPTMYYIQSPF